MPDPPHSPSKSTGIMRLILAEKPSLARSIADALDQPIPGSRFITCGNTTVTWCIGHLLEPLRPEDYAQGAFIRREDLPVIPPVWKLQPRDQRAKDQLKVIQSLLRNASEVVHAGDADREGQLLVDEVLRHLGWRGKTLRLWTGSLDAETVQRALASLQPNEAMHSLYESALARQRADWLLGYNASIALSRNLKSQGMDGGWSIGRVQTPTLALIVDRASQIKGHTKQAHYKVQITLTDGVTAHWQIPEDLLADKLLLDQAQAEATVQAVEGQTGTVRTFTRRTLTRAAPFDAFMENAIQRARQATEALSGPLAVNLPVATGPACPSCRQNTRRHLTRNSKPYFRCAQYNQNYWPGFNDPQKLGKAWEPKP
jgi:DNA topoisomerase-3